MPWDYILGGASGAGLVFIFGIIFLNKYLERFVDSRFEERLERFRSELTRELEFDKSDLAAWADLRKDVLCQLWSTHRDLSRLMTQVILQVQEVQWSGRELGSMRDAIEKRSYWIPGSYVTSNAMSAGSNALPRFLTLCTNSKNPR
jgi:hypothetical protein